MAEPPRLTSEQRERALAEAVAARRARAELKEGLKRGTLTLRELLDRADVDETVGKMKVLAVLESLPGVGKARARRAMEDIGIADTRRLRGLIEPTRRALLDSFSSDAEGQRKDRDERQAHQSHQGLRAIGVMGDLPILIALEVDSDETADTVLRHALDLASHLGYSTRTD